MAGTLQATGPAPRWDLYDLHHSPRDIHTMNARVPKYSSLMSNLTKMTQAVHTLYQTPAFAPFFVNETLTLACRLTWIMLYFCGAMSHFFAWITTQDEVDSVAQTNHASWSGEGGFLPCLGNLFSTVANLPTGWFAQGTAAIREDATQAQTIPCEAPLELVAQICLNVSDAVAPGLTTPDLVQGTLRGLAVANDFPPGFNANNHDGFSNCIFVTQYGPPNRALVAGSTVLYLGYINLPAVQTAFTDLRQLRFTQGASQYDNELRARFHEDPLNPYTTPERRFADPAVGWTRASSGREVLANMTNLVRTRLIQEYNGTEPTRVAPALPPAPVLPPAQRRVWVPFRYPGQSARSNFAPLTHNHQATWFEPTPRCMKCRVIHNYTIVDEDLAVRAVPNRTCQCAEDIVYGKLRQLDLVGNVVLAGL